MSDRFSPDERSRIMSKIRGKDTKQELIIRKLIFSMGFRYRLHYSKLMGKPDIAFPGRKKAIFVNGCFWHGHNCKRGKLPVTNYEFWFKKISGNIQRDKANIAALEELGWKTLIIWQCEINKKQEEHLRNMIRQFLCTK
ncbi:MAG: DNA mismatch endonuclease Vsr [Calditrichaeota bacterium]|nr:DNA mismatch endonuclease Vsr [Calditrichota bacterium]